MNLLGINNNNNLFLTHLQKGKSEVQGEKKLQINKKKHE